MGWMESTHLIGGQGGSEFEFYDKNGSILKRIRVWVGGWLIRGVYVELSNGESRMFGHEERDACEFTFSPGELIETLTLWGNGIGSRLGAIKFRTTHGREFFACMRDWPLKTAYDINVGSGICAGVKGRHGADIDKMGFIFVKKLRSCQLVNVHYPSLNAIQPNVHMMTLASQEFANRTGQMQETRYVNESKLVLKKSWSSTTGFEMAVKYEVTAGVPEVIQFKSGADFKVSVSTTHQSEQTTERTERWELPIKVKPHTLVTARIIIGKVDVRLPYSATMIATTADGDVLSFKVNGVYEGVSYTTTKIDVKEGRLTTSL